MIICPQCCFAELYYHKNTQQLFFGIAVPDCRSVTSSARHLLRGWGPSHSKLMWFISARYTNPLFVLLSYQNGDEIFYIALYFQLQSFVRQLMKMFSLFKERDESLLNIYDTSAEALYFLLVNYHVWNQGSDLFERLWQCHTNSKCMLIKLFVAEIPTI